MAAGDNPRFVVTNLPAEGFRGEDRQRFRAARLYEEIYCGRGEMENVLKQQTLDLSADRHSTHQLGSNQLRLWLATLAYLLLERLRSVGLRGSELARATVGTIRTRLLKVAARVTVSVRRVGALEFGGSAASVVSALRATTGRRGGRGDVVGGKLPSPTPEARERP